MHSTHTGGNTVYTLRFTDLIITDHNLFITIE